MPVARMGHMHACLHACEPPCTGSMLIRVTHHPLQVAAPSMQACEEGGRRGCFLQIPNCLGAKPMELPAGDSSTTASGGASAGPAALAWVFVVHPLAVQQAAGRVDIMETLISVVSGKALAAHGTHAYGAAAASTGESIHTVRMRLLPARMHAPVHLQPTVKLVPSHRVCTCAPTGQGRGGQGLRQRAVGTAQDPQARVQGAARLHGVRSGLLAAACCREPANVITAERRVLLLTAFSTELEVPRCQPQPLRTQAQHPAAAHAAAGGGSSRGARQQQRQRRLRAVRRRTARRAAAAGRRHQQGAARRQQVCLQRQAHSRRQQGQRQGGCCPAHRRWASGGGRQCGRGGGGRRTGCAQLEAGV